MEMDRMTHRERLHALSLEMSRIPPNVRLHTKTFLAEPLGFRGLSIWVRSDASPAERASLVLRAGFSIASGFYEPSDENPTGYMTAEKVAARIASAGAALLDRDAAAIRDGLWP